MESRKKDRCRQIESRRTVNLTELLKLLSRLKFRWLLAPRSILDRAPDQFCLSGSRATLPDRRFFGSYLKVIAVATLDWALIFWLSVKHATKETSSEKIVTNATMENFSYRSFRPQRVQVENGRAALQALRDLTLRAPSEHAPCHSRSGFEIFNFSGFRSSPSETLRIAR